MGEYEHDDEIRSLDESKQVQNNIFSYGTLTLVFILLCLIAWSLTACTITQTMIHTVGADSGDVSDTANSTPTVAPNTSLSVPLIGQ